MLKNRVISPAVKSDLRDICTFGLKNWGQAPAENYLTAIQNQLWTLLQHSEIGVERTDLLPGLSSLTVKNHVLFYRIRSGNVEIIRVLHGRQDPISHLL